MSAISIIGNGNTAWIDRNGLMSKPCAVAAFKPLWFEDKSRTVSVASAFGLASFVLCYAAISISGEVTTN